MTHIVPLDSLPEYPDLFVSKRLQASVAEQGLIEPVVINRKKQVHPHDRELFEAFRRACASHGDEGTKTCIVVYWHELTADDRAAYR